MPGLLISYFVFFCFYHPFSFVFNVPSMTKPGSLSIGTEFRAKVEWKVTKRETNKKNQAVKKRKTTIVH